MPEPRILKPGTVAVHAGRPPHEADQPLNTPITMASTYVAGGDLEYGRYGNPTWTAFEDALGELEGGRCLSFASGMAAVATILDLVGARRRRWSRRGTPTTARWCSSPTSSSAAGSPPSSSTSPTPTAVVEACDDAALVWFESPTNPALEVADIPAIIAAAHEAGARVVVDNTFATPLLQRPLELGADIVRALGDEVPLRPQRRRSWARSSPATTSSTACSRAAATSIGAMPGPFEAYLALRGLRTLHLRVERAQANASELARRLDGHPALAEVRYPGLGAIVSIVLPSGARPPTCWPAHRAVGARHQPRRRRVVVRAAPPLEVRAGDHPRGRWSGSRSASRTSTTCGPTSRRRSTP